jgi:hypothetical protein
MLSQVLTTLPQIVSAPKVLSWKRIQMTQNLFVNFGTLLARFASENQFQLRPANVHNWKTPETLQDSCALLRSHSSRAFIAHVHVKTSATTENVQNVLKAPHVLQTLFNNWNDIARHPKGPTVGTSLFLGAT